MFIYTSYNFCNLCNILYSNIIYLLMNDYTILKIKHLNIIIYYY